ncbi:CSMD1 [Symbiodinium natans]|uniref:CSMD1 protein n=1 Tax=Symbiodinium natans TaxID=878477 RepID=A0A812U5D4_9DINO|nr:CSMD1 [Symbiodinium natans]
MEDNCTNLVAGESCQQTCAQGFLPASGSSAIHFACDLQGNINISGSMPQCEQIKCNASVLIPNVEHTCSEVLSGGSCFAFCSEGYQMQSSKASEEWRCAHSDSGLSAVSTVPMVEGYTLRGLAPVCRPLACLYKMPSGSEYEHNCENIGTNSSCNVTCAEGFEGGGQETWTCLPDRSFAGNLPTCLEITSTATTSVTSTVTSTSATATFSTTHTATTTTFWNGTVLITGYFEITPSREERRRLRENDASVLNSEFINASEVEEGIVLAMASILNVSSGAVHINLTFATDAETMDEVVRVYYLASRAFPTPGEADDFTNFVQNKLSSITSQEVQDVLNTMLESTGAVLRIGALRSMTLSVSRAEETPTKLDIRKAPEDESGIIWYVGLIGCILVIMGLSGLLWYFIYKSRKEEEEEKAAQDPAKNDGSETTVVIDEPAEPSEPIADNEAKVMVKDQPAEAEGLRQAGADPATELELQPFSEDPTDEPMQVREI